MDTIVEVEITAPGYAWTIEFTRRLVEARLAAGGSIEQARLRSIYHWAGGISDEPESRVRFHTRASLMPHLVAIVNKEHPYEVPGVRWWQIEASPEYGQWVLDETLGDYE